MAASTSLRLHAAIALVCPVVSVAITGPQTATLQLAPEATVPQQNAARAALAAFDWSPAADAAWDRDQQRTVAKAVITSLSTPCSKSLRAVLLLLLDELNLLRAAVVPPLPARTMTQLRNAIGTKIDSGGAD